MRIGIDGIALTIKFACGTKHYAQELIKALAKIDKHNQYIIFAAQPIQLPMQNNFSIERISHHLPFFRRQLWLSQAVNQARVDVLHYLHPYGAMWLRHPGVVTTVYDTKLDQIFPIFDHPKYFFQRYYSEITRKGVFYNTHSFITISKAVQRELVNYLSRMGKNAPIYPIHLGVDSQFNKASVLSKAQGYMLTFADYSPRKNIKRILHAYSLLPKNLRGKYKLRIVISTDFLYGRIIQLTQRYGIFSEVEILANISLNKLAILYRNATCLVYPSLYEGFGLPSLEAMSSGCPVITSNIGAMKEVGGDAVYFVNPYSITEITQAMRTLIENKPISNILSQKGLIRARQFSWERTALQTIKVYEKVFAS